MSVMSSRRTLVAVLACLAPACVAGPAFADAGGVPHVPPGDSIACGVGAAEAQAFIADPTLPGASEITQYPPVASGCTGQSR
jgi:hypothetical protein